MSKEPSPAALGSNGRSPADNGHRSEYAEDVARGWQARSFRTRAREVTAQARSESARLRNEAAAARDRLADERDAAAEARDELAARFEAEMGPLEFDARDANGNRALGKRAVEIRARCVRQREASARDRRQAARDRHHAALDRDAATAELLAEGIDHLTGTLRRRVGMVAMQRELDRAQRTGENLVVAFVDVDGLKAVNDHSGHAAGDELLRAVADSISAHLRPYDVVIRFGGDEFVCSLTGADIDGAGRRFALIRADIAKGPERSSISVGFAEWRAGGSLPDLITEADGAMIRGRDSQHR